MENKDHCNIMQLILYSTCSISSDKVLYHIVIIEYLW